MMNHTLNIIITSHVKIEGLLKSHMKIQKEYIKFLGVIIDSHLNWKQHMLNILISRCIGIMCKVRQIRNNK